MPVRVLRAVARKAIRTDVLAPSGRIPPSGTISVWSEIVGLTATPSTVRLEIARRPSRAATALSSSRSTGPPDTLVTSIVDTAERVRRV